MKKIIALLTYVLLSFLTNFAMEIPTPPEKKEENVSIEALEPYIEKIINNLKSSTIYKEIDYFNDQNSTKSTFIEEKNIGQIINFFIKVPYVIGKKIEKIVETELPNNKQQYKEIISDILLDITIHDGSFAIAYWMKRLEKENIQKYQEFKQLIPPIKIFGWCINCPEAPLIKRIMLILLICEKIKKEFKPTDHIVYTSYGSGRLFQDYLTIKSLTTQGYNNITINLIDKDYSTKNPDFINITNLYINEFRKKLNKLKVHIFENASDYSDAIKKEKTALSTILIAVDLGQIPEQTMRYSDINVLYLNDLKHPDVIITLPPFSPIQIYAKDTHANKALQLQELFKTANTKDLDEILTIIKKIYPQSTTKKLSDPYLLFYKLVAQAATDNTIVTLLGAQTIIMTNKKEIIEGKYPSPMTFKTSDYYQLMLHNYKIVD